MEVKSDDVVVNVVRRSRFIEHLGFDDTNGGGRSAMQDRTRVELAVDSAVGLVEDEGGVDVEGISDRVDEDGRERVVRKEGKKRWKNVLKKVVRMLCSREKVPN
jgi:hypothetical protein